MPGVVLCTAKTMGSAPVEMQYIWNELQCDGYALSCVFWGISEEEVKEKCMQLKTNHTIVAGRGFGDVPEHILHA